jgi:hypothetical protein
MSKGKQHYVNPATKDDPACGLFFIIVMGLVVIISMILSR